MENKSIFRSAPMFSKKKALQEQRLAKMNFQTSGKGEFLFQNNTKGDIYLPRPTKSGQKTVCLNGQFVGDDYYFQMVKSNELKFIKEMSEPMNRLITEQPPIVTKEGTMEYVVEKPESKINEQEQENKDVLLLESPIDGIKILN